MSNSIVKNSLIVMFLVIIGKAVSFIRDVVVSKYFGVSDITDAYFMANNIPIILYAALIASVLMFFIPIYAEIREHDGVEKANVFVSNLWNILLITSITFSILGVVFSPYLTMWAAPGFSGEKYQLTVQFSRLLVLSFPFTSTIFLFAALQNANNKFLISQTPTMIAATTIIISIICFSKYIGIYSLILSSIGITIANAIIQRASCRKFYTHSWVLDIKSPSIKRMFYLACPVFIGLSADEFNIFVNGIICSSLSTGSISFLNYAQRLLQTINGTCMNAIIIVIYPLLSVLAAKADFNSINNILGKTLRIVTILLLPITLVILLYSYEIVELVFQRGSFSSTSTKETSAVLACYAISIIFLAYREFLNRIFFILKDAKTPAIIGVCSVILNIILSLILVKFYQVKGLAIAASFASIFTCILQYLILKKRTASIANTIFPLKFLITLTCAGSVFFFVNYILKNTFFIYDFKNIFIFIISLFAFLCYCAILYLSKTEELIILLDILENKIKKMR